MGVNQEQADFIAKYAEGQWRQLTVAEKLMATNSTTIQAAEILFNNANADTKHQYMVRSRTNGVEGKVK